VITRARQVLAQLEEHERKSPVEMMIDDLPLFSAVRKPAPAHAPAASDTALTLLDELHPDDMTPREALEALYRLKTARKAPS